MDYVLDPPVGCIRHDLRHALLQGDNLAEEALKAQISNGSGGLITGKIELPRGIPMIAENRSGSDARA